MSSAPRLSQSRKGLLSAREGLRFQFVSQLIELVEVDTWPETKRVRDGARRRTPLRLRLFAEARAQRPIHHSLEWQAELARPLLQQSCQIVVDGESGAHTGHH